MRKLTLASNVLIGFVGVLMVSALAWCQAGAGPTASNSIIVGPGETGTNGDVSVTNTSVGRGPIGPSPKAVITPGHDAFGRPVTDAASSKVKTQANFSGSISGLEAGDGVGLGTNNNATVAGTGGTVKLGNGGSTTVVNNGTPGPGATPIKVVMEMGNSFSVWPGSTVTVP